MEVIWRQLSQLLRGQIISCMSNQQVQHSGKMDVDTKLWQHLELLRSINIIVEISGLVKLLNPETLKCLSQMIIIIRLDIIRLLMFSKIYISVLFFFVFPAHVHTCKWNKNCTKRWLTKMREQSTADVETAGNFALRSAPLLSHHRGKQQLLEQGF